MDNLLLLLITFTALFTTGMYCLLTYSELHFKWVCGKRPRTLGPIGYRTQTQRTSIDPGVKHLNVHICLITAV